MIASQGGIHRVWYWWGWNDQQSGEKNPKSKMRKFSTTFNTFYKGHIVLKPQLLSSVFLILQPISFWLIYREWFKKSLYFGHWLDENCRTAECGLFPQLPRSISNHQLLNNHRKHVPMDFIAKNYNFGKFRSGRALFLHFRTFLCARSDWDSPSRLLHLFGQMVFQSETKILTFKAAKTMLSHV